MMIGALLQGIKTAAEIAGTVGMVANALGSSSSSSSSTPAVVEVEKPVPVPVVQQPQPIYPQIQTPPINMTVNVNIYKDGELEVDTSNGMPRVQHRMRRNMVPRIDDMDN